MYRILKNHERTLAACPVLGEEHIGSYLKTGELQMKNVSYMPVPPGVVLINRAAWLVPNTRVHSAGSVFLVATDIHEMDPDVIPDRIDCYYSPVANAHFFGRVCEGKLMGLMVGEYPDFDLADLNYVGRVMASR